MKRVIFFLIIFSAYADEPEALIDAPVTHLEIIDETILHEPVSLIDVQLADLADHTSEATSPANIFESFQRFIRYFLILLNNPEIGTNIKIIEQMISNLMQTALAIIKENKIPVDSMPKDVAEELLAHDPALKKAFTEAVQKGARDFKSLRKHHSPNCTCGEKTDRTTQIVIGNFARIASHFFNILQDPNNSENVAPNLVGMLSGIVSIGTEVIKSGKLDPDINEEEIIQYVKRLDYATKGKLVETVFKTIS